MTEPQGDPIELTPEELEQYPTVESRRELDPHEIYVGRGWCPAVDFFGGWCNQRADHPDEPHRAPLILPDQTVTWVAW